MIRNALAPLMLALSACASLPVGTAAGPTATPVQLHQRVGSFAQPTQDGRLAALKAQLDAAKLPYVVEDFAGKRTTGPGHNVVVRTGPETGKAILLTAHYDAVVLPDGQVEDALGAAHGRRPRREGREVQRHSLRHRHPFDALEPR